MEFEEAQKIANSQTKVYGQVTNVLLAVATLVFSIALDKDEKKEGAINFVNSYSILFACVLFLFGCILLRYFVDLQKQITINARKVVTLRTLLGLDYGHIHLTLPHWRVEGANNPFVIKYFNGWLKFSAMPFWLITITVNVVWGLATKDKFPIEITCINAFNLKCGFWFGNLIITLFYLAIFRIYLYDTHETFFLSCSKLICSLLRIKLLDGFEYILYRAKLSYLELERLNVKYEALTHMLVDLEDTSFYTNSGISIKSLMRAALSRIAFFRKRNNYIRSGGSTITMQLARTLFIPSKQNKYLRKIAELFLSLWLSRQFSKKEILKIYVASVRYEKGVIGLTNALKHFFGELRDKNLSKEEAFFLVERLSNITSRVRRERIRSLLNKVKGPIDLKEVERIYDRQIETGNLK